jgi:hypothetical protein
VRYLGVSQLPRLTSLVLHDLPHLWSLKGNGFKLYDLPGLAELAPSLRNLSITGARDLARAPASLSALVNLTRLELTLRQAAREPSYRMPSDEPLFKRSEWRSWRSGASPLDGCCNLRELILADNGPRLTFPPRAMQRLTALRVLDVRGVRAPVLDRKLLLTAMPSLARLTVPRGALPPELILRLGRRGRGRLPRLWALFGFKPPAGCDVVVEEVGEGPNAAAPGGAAPAPVLLTPPLPPPSPLPSVECDAAFLLLLCQALLVAVLAFVAFAFVLVLVLSMAAGAAPLLPLIAALLVAVLAIFVAFRQFASPVGGDVTTQEPGAHPDTVGFWGAAPAAVPPTPQLPPPSAGPSRSVECDAAFLRLLCQAVLVAVLAFVAFVLVLVLTLA